MEKAEKQAAIAAFVESLKGIVKVHQPTDMDADKTMGRAMMLPAFIGQSRTSAVAAAVYVAMSGPVVGLKREEVLNIVNGAYDEAEKAPVIDEIRKEYEQMNAEHHAKLKAKQDAADSGAILVPGSEE